MKSEKTVEEKKLAAGFRINPALDDKQYKEHPYFKEKLEKANAILRKTGVPKF